MQTIQIYDMLSGVFCGTKEKTKGMYMLGTDATAN